jgi:ATP/maltotriose-dependent transcriptional regulator MalT
MTSLTPGFAGPDEARPRLWLPRRRSLLLRTPGHIVFARTLPTTLPAKSDQQQRAPWRRPFAHRVRLHPPALDLDAFEFVDPPEVAPSGAQGAPPPPPIVTPADLPEPLSARECEVLRALAQGATNRELAGALSISAGTVRWHLSNIYGKLGVQRRTQAIARGRALGLLLDE